MSHNQAILLLGTNLGDKNQNLKSAEKRIIKEIGEVENKSEILETEPVGFISENNFLNQALLVHTSLSPVSLLKAVQSIEKEMGRIKTNPQQRYEDRIIDIDILNFNGLIFESPQLKLPHPQVYSREFVKTLLKF